MAIIFLAIFIVGKESIKIFIKEENQKVNFTAKHGICQSRTYYYHVLHELHLIGAIILDVAMSSELFNQDWDLISEYEQ